jgi:beta-glucosidase
VRPREQGGCGCVAEGATGDVAADHFNRFREDIALMQSLGIRHYRLSLSWPRLIPQGVVGKGGGGKNGTLAAGVSAEGVAFYKTLVRALRAASITPVATLYHWDLPHALQDAYGGFAAEDPTRFAADFAAYADVAFSELSGPGLVDEWITFNEPISICSLGYGQGIFAPGVKGGKDGEHRCGHALLLAHAAAAKVYNEKGYRARSGGKGKLSIALDGKWGRPWAPNDASDLKAADAFTLFQFGWMADPLYFGDYPPEMRRAYGSKSLPFFTEKQRADLRASKPDALSLNFYTSYWVKNPDAMKNGAQAPAGTIPYNVTYGWGPGGAKIGAQAASSWLFVAPDAFRSTLEWLSARYGSPEIWVTENGVSVKGEHEARPPAVLRDAFRVDYFSRYLGALCRAVSSPASGVKVNLTKYFSWSLIDNFEWLMTYTERFGIVWVDYKGGSLERVPKDSARWLKEHFFTKGRA